VVIRLIFLGLEFGNMGMGRIAPVEGQSIAILIGYEVTPLIQTRAVEMAGATDHESQFRVQIHC